MIYKKEMGALHLAFQGHFHYAIIKFLQTVIKDDKPGAAVNEVALGKVENIVHSAGKHSITTFPTTFQFFSTQLTII